MGTKLGEHGRLLQRVVAAGREPGDRREDLGDSWCPQWEWRRRGTRRRRKRAVQLVFESQDRDLNVARFEALLASKESTEADYGDALAREARDGLKSTRGGALQRGRRRCPGLAVGHLDRVASLEPPIACGLPSQLRAVCRARQGWLNSRRIHSRSPKSRSEACSERATASIRRRAAADRARSRRWASGAVPYRVLTPT